MQTKRFSQYVKLIGFAAAICVVIMFVILPDYGNPANEQKMIEDITRLLLSEISKLSMRLTSLEQQNKSLERTLAKLLDEQERGGRLLPEQVQDHMAKMYEMPKVVSFANERVPIDKWDVWQRLDSEFFTFLIDQRQVILWLKRMGQFFPYIEEELEKAGLPDDLKYVTIIESGLRASVTSSAGASGFWQFISSTGNQYGLEQNAWLDNRRDLYASTQAAIKYFKNLYGIFHDWPLVLAAYNCGEGRVQNAMRDQRVHNYYQLELPRETERYVFKIIAAKIILADPKKYGFYFDDNNLFPPPQFEEVTVHLKSATHLRDLAAQYGTYYREIRLLNPELSVVELPAGTHRLKVPKGWQKLVKARSPAPAKAAAAPIVVADADQITYTVQKGDSLGKIAQRFNVSVDNISKLKGQTATLSTIHPGETLLILKK